MLAQHGLGIRPECARVLRVLTRLLQKAAAGGLTPFAVGSLMCRCGRAPASNTLQCSMCACDAMPMLGSAHSTAQDAALRSHVFASGLVLLRLASSAQTLS